MLALIMATQQQHFLYIHPSIADAPWHIPLWIRYTITHLIGCYTSPQINTTRIPSTMSCQKIIVFRPLHITTYNKLFSCKHIIITTRNTPAYHHTSFLTPHIHWTCHMHIWHTNIEFKVVVNDCFSLSSGALCNCYPPTPALFHTLFLNLNNLNLK